VKPGDIPEYVDLHWHRELCQCFYFSRTRGTEIDAEMFETKQGAPTTADLSQQEPRVEVVDLIPSVASSDEDRFAAGISRIGLQTKRLSGAQRKRLIRERKLREGTWTENSISE